MFVRLALKFVICNDGDFVNIILIYTVLIDPCGFYSGVCKACGNWNETPCNLVEGDRYLPSYGKKGNSLKYIRLLNIFLFMHYTSGDNFLQI